MNRIAAKAKQSNELVFAYSQGEFNFKDIGPWGNVRNGYCAAMGFRWMAAILDRSNLDFDPVTLEAPRQDWTVTKEHNETKSLGYDAVMAVLGIKRDLSMKKTIDGAPSVGKILGFIGSRPGVYMLQYKREGGGHLAAIRNDIDSYDYFDANFGHFRFASLVKFYNWYSNFMLDTGYDTRYQKSVILTQITK